MLIALDYDDTYTEDPELWLTFIEVAKMRGHTVYVVTMRYQAETSSMDSRLMSAVQGVIATGRQQKREFTEKMGLYFHIWIDDHPEYIVKNPGFVVV